MLIVDRENNLDVLTVMVEVDEKYFSDEIRKLDQLKIKVGAVLKQALGVSVRVKLVEPKKHRCNTFLLKRGLPFLWL